MLSYSKPTFPDKNKGFSLVEMAIVIIVIGILIAGVIKGKELVLQSRLQAYSEDFLKLRAHLALFKDQYETWPSDVTTSECAALGWGSPCSATSSRSKTINSTLTSYFWHQMMQAFPAFIAGEEITTGGRRFLPRNWEFRTASPPNYGRWNASYSTVTSAWGKTLYNYIWTENSNSWGTMKTSEAKRIDTKIDDGIANRGAVYGFGTKCSAVRTTGGTGGDYGDGTTNSAEDDNACGFIIFLDDWE